MQKPQSNQVNINVIVRSRPTNVSEQSKTQNQVKLHSRTNIVEARQKPYSFDAVYGPETTQEVFYESAINKLVQDFLQGFNCSIFAYGQTGSGKTYTMSGTDSDRGVIPRTVYTLFEYLENQNIDFQLRCSFMEVYNEELYDLLEDIREPLKMFEERAQSGVAKPGSNITQNKIVIQNLSEILVKKPEEVLKLLEKANQNRKVAETMMNERSSRSHSIFCLQLVQKQIEINQNTNQEIEFIKISKLNLVDLAGSENVQKSGASGQQMQEASRINKSLLTLGRVINCLTEGKPHVPYRESKLTRLLQDSLGGKTKTTIVATISPSDLQLEETISTLDYMSRAKKIKNAPEIMQKVNSKNVLKEYTAELKHLRELLDMQRQNQGGVFLKEEEYENYQEYIANRNEKVRELEGLIQNQLLEIGRINEVLTMQQKKYQSVKHDLGNAVTHMTGQNEDLHAFQEKVIQGRVVEQQNQQNMDAFKINFQSNIDEIFRPNNIEAVKIESGFNKAVQSYQQGIQIVQKRVVDSLTKYETNIESLQYKLHTELQSSVNLSVTEKLSELIMILQEDTQKPMNKFDIIEKVKKINQLIQNQTNSQMSLFSSFFKTSRQDISQDIIQFSEDISKSLSVVQAEVASIHKQLKSTTMNTFTQLDEVHNLNKKLKETLNTQILSSQTQFKQQMLDLLAQQFDIQNDNLTSIQKVIFTPHEQRTAQLYQTMRDKLAELTKASSEGNAKIDQHITKSNELVKRNGVKINEELVKINSANESLDNGLKNMINVVQQNQQTLIVDEFEVLRIQITKAVEDQKRYIKDLQSSSTSTIMAKNQTNALAIQSLAQEAVRTNTNSITSLPQLQEILNKNTILTQQLGQQTNQVVLQQLQNLSYNSVLPKSHTPTINSPPFRGIGLEQSGVIGVATPSLKK
ncbi:Kinesin-like protein [Spironucleus salmonicida]|uniref:Kinesin-like protein n=1 Tax=Spironucleus salmonicida TaxID=348837 RepID=V6LQY3_9EUKA|nr:Kinesin-like protein [Spironucleus salmonicida]|eukprot:EST46116.1 Kinesin-5 [Spironucleus salmonicida]